MPHIKVMLHYNIDIVITGDIQQFSLFYLIYTDNFAFKDNYYKSKLSEELIEWIPHNEFKDITHPVNEESSKLYNAIWSNGHICDWDEDKLDWRREIKNLKVTLINIEFLKS